MKKILRHAALILLAALPAGCQQQERSFAILSINDVYRIEGLQSGAGGLARVRALRAELEETYPDLLFLHGGDFLFPSLLSRSLHGEQMVDVLNRLDGSSGDASFDKNMFVVFGNHEFDKADAEDFGIIDARISESEFSWLGTNVFFGSGFEVQSDNLIRRAMVESGGVKIGIFSLMLNVPGVEYATFTANPDQLPEIARSESQQLRDKGAEFVVALTHLPVATDRKVIAVSGGPDLVIGGHDHFSVDTRVNGRCILKADADAITVWQTTVTIRDGAGPLVTAKLHSLGPEGSIGADANVAARVRYWLDRHQEAFCAEDNPGCLDTKLAQTATTLVAEELQIRSEESNLGNWVADQMLAAVRNSGVEKPNMIAMVHSGSLRLNQNIDESLYITRRHVEELIQYDDPLFLVELSRQDLQKGLDHSISRRGDGPWLQVSGLTFDADVSDGKAKNVLIGGTPLESLDKVFAVLPKYIVTRGGAGEGDHDGYEFIGDDSNRLDIRLKDVVVQGLLNAPVIDGHRTISPEIEGRVRLINLPPKSVADSCSGR